MKKVTQADIDAAKLSVTQLERRLKNYRERYMNNCLCKKCGCIINDKNWEETVCTATIKITRPHSVQQALWGKDFTKYSNHPAVEKVEAGSQTMELKIGHKYNICMSCHTDFVKMIGDFIGEDYLIADKHFQIK